MNLRSPLDLSAVAYPRKSLRATMLEVILALTPGIAVYAVLVSEKILINLLLAGTMAIVFESIALGLRGRSVWPSVGDGSIVLAAILLTLAVPPSLPYWQLTIGIAVMVLLGKQVFGGLGHNPFNPAMVGYAFLLISFPVTMTNWTSVATDASGTIWDSITQATPLDHLRAFDIGTTTTALSAESLQLMRTDAFELIFESPWPTVSAAWLVGGLFLLWRRLTSWHIPVSVLASISCLYLAQSIFSDTFSTPLTAALFSGAIMLGAFFIATDPVTAASGVGGKLIYGTGIGIFTFVIREYSSYPEGFAFAVLLMNMTVPLIDHLSASSVRLRQHD